MPKVHEKILEEIIVENFPKMGNLNWSGRIQEYVLREVIMGLLSKSAAGTWEVVMWLQKLHPFHLLRPWPPLEISWTLNHALLMSDQWRSPVISWILAARLYPRYQLSGKASSGMEPWTRRAVTGVGREKGWVPSNTSLPSGDTCESQWPLSALVNYCE